MTEKKQQNVDILYRRGYIHGMHTMLDICEALGFEAPQALCDFLNNDLEDWRARALENHSVEMPPEFRLTKEKIDEEGDE